MPAVVSRPVLSLAVIAAVPAVYFVAFVLFYEGMNYRSDEFVMLLCNLITGAFLAAAWLAVWFGEIKWTPLRAGLTIGGLFGLMLVAVVVGLLTALITREEEIAILIAGVFWVVTWLASTALIWRETKGERAARLQKLGVSAIACPNCQYNLNGLSAAQCPECGSKFTLDQLFAAAIQSRRQTEIA